MPFTDHADIQRELAAPFPENVIGWKAQVTTKDGKKALAVPYIDARDVQDRLDAVLGIGNWESHFRVLDHGGVICTLRLFIDGRWIEKEDADGLSDQPDDGDKLKAAVSGSLKRAAVQVGIGRYLYRLPDFWCAYDSQRRQVTERPVLPEWALPRKTAPKPYGQREQPQKPDDKPAPSQVAEKPGVAFLRILCERANEMSATGACAPKDYMDAVRKQVRPGEPAESWTDADADAAGRHAALFELALLDKELERTGYTWEQALSSQTAQEVHATGMLRKNLKHEQRVAFVATLHKLPAKKPS